MQLLTVTASKRTDPQKLYKINYSLGKAKYIISHIYICIQYLMLLKITY